MNNIIASNIQKTKTFNISKYISKLIKKLTNINIILKINIFMTAHFIKYKKKN